MAQRKLTFVIAGTQKGGTCTLDGLFRLHSQIQMATVKETHFFDNEQHNWDAPDYGALESLYPVEDDRLRGEATPITMYWRPAVLRLHGYNPNTKLIILLRNPVTRAFSNWRKEYSIYRDELNFHDAIREGCARMRTNQAPPGLHRIYSYVDRGRYGEQLTFLLRYFPKENIHCEVSEEFFSNRAPVLTRIARFLGIDSFAANLPHMHLNPGRIFRYPSILTIEDVTYLRQIYQQDIKIVESFMGRRIDVWNDELIYVPTLVG